MRICQLCNSGSVENEYHFLFHCPRLSEVRDTHAFDYDTRLENVSDSSKLNFMLTEENIEKTGKYLEKLYQARQRLIYK